MKNKNILKNDSTISGFSLPEILVTMLIIGILVFLALPNLMPLITKAKSTEAKIQLGHVHMLEKTYFFEHSKYCENLDDISFEQEKLVNEGGQANYKIEIVHADISSFKATATAIVDFDGDGIFNIWEIDENKQMTEIQKD